MNVFFGAVVKPRLGEEMRVSLIASVDYHEMQAAVLADESAAAAAETATEADEPESAAAQEEVESEETPAAISDDDEDVSDEESAVPYLEPEEE